MFVEQSTVKIWRIRLAFIVLCVVPTCCLCYFAALRQSEGYRQQIADKASKILGRQVQVEGMTHPQPGCLKLTGIEVAGQSLSSVSVVNSKHEVRLAVGGFVLDQHAIPFVVGLVDRWLSEPIQFQKDYLIDIKDFAWQDSGSIENSEVRPLRVECVSAGSGRAIRFFFRDDDKNEIRVARVLKHGSRNGSAEKHVTELQVNVSEAIPVSCIFAALRESGGRHWDFGDKAVFSGQIDISNAGGDWTAECSGTIDHVDLDATTSMLSSHLQGAAKITLNKFLWSRSRIENVDCVCVADRGEIEQVWIDRLVRILGCRIDEAYHHLSGSQARSFQRLGFGLVIDSEGLQLRALPGRSGCLLESQELPVILEPVQAATLDRLAWLLSGTRPPAVPGTDVTAWLLSVLPIPNAYR
ncbi:MAG: hypothetical protein HOD99_07435 [Planctomycetaceae bacterium]|nr:hypothetical protein [Planctomycetaceae bacterium]